MSKDRFSVLLDAIREDIRVDEHMAEISSGDPVFEYLQLAICIRYLAGAALLHVLWSRCCSSRYPQVAATLILLTHTLFMKQPLCLLFGK